MKVAMIARATLFSVPGGDTIQIENTAKELRNLGVEVDVKLCNEGINYNNYQLLHFFNIIRPAGILAHISKTSVPYLLSTIFVDYSEYEKKARGGWIGGLSKLISADSMEYLKVIGRSIFNNEWIVDKSYLFKGHTRSIKHILGNAAMLLPNSENEYKRLEHRYKLLRPYRVIPNAIDAQIFRPESRPKESTLVLCAARIEGLKNQLNLIRALQGTNFKLIIVGTASPNHRAYYNQCRSEAGNNVEFIQQMDQAELAKLYNRAKVHVLPSWFETTGLSSLEAAAMQCNIVITGKGDTREYFGAEAFYCEPDDIMSIRKAVELASLAPVNYSLSAKIIEQYNWERAAQETKKAYEEVLPVKLQKMKK